MNFRRAQDVSPVGLRHPSVTPRARNCKGPTLAAVHLTFAESCSNDRDQLSLPYQGGSVSTPVHLFSVTGKYAAAPVLIYSGGVDTYKMDLHPVCLTLA